ncbi:MAG: 4-hydroxybutyrate dehydrogenase / sulfolactaldehyde 3-reductase [Variibacter sp.]|nr:4-hydroxybutyrate dehydrogenase / sulfolactaldehyde 3-reductase [Variibacter sp.]
MPDAIKTVAFIGVGTMGKPMARNLLKGGFALRIHDLMPEAGEDLVREGAAWAASPAEAARGADCVITMLPNGPHVEEAVFEKTGIAEGIAKQAIYIDMSTIAPGVTDSIAQRLGARGVTMLDAPVGRLPQHAVEGKLLIMVGGDAEALERTRPVFEKLGDTIVHCGPVGSGARMKLVNNFMSITLNATTAEALTLAEASGVDPELARKVMLGTAAGQGHMGSTYPAKVLKGDLTPGFMIDLAAKDLGLALELGEQLGLDLATGRGAQGKYAEAREHGHGRSDWTALYAHARDRIKARKTRA